jgi:hypothetical protein
MGRAALLYAAASALYTWPLIVHPASHLAAPVGPGDPYLYLWVFGWVMGAILRSPVDVLNGRVFNANIFFPAENTLAYSDHMILQSAALTPLYALTGDVVLCYNVLLIASLFLSGVAMHAFVRSVTGSTGGAYLAGLAWAFFPYRFAHLVHIQLQALYFLPLAFLLLHRVVAGRRTRDAVGLGVALALQALSAAYYGVIGAVGIGTAAVTLAVAVGRWRSAALARHYLVAAAVGAVLVAPVTLVYWRVQRDAGFGRTLYEASRNAARLDSYLRVPSGNVAYAATGMLPVGNLEHALFPGLVLVGLAALGAARGLRRDARPLVLAMLCTGTLAFVLSLGPDGLRDAYALFQRYFFGFQAIRAPSRFAVLVTFSLAALAALGWRELAARGPRARALAWALTAAAAVEYLNVPMPLAPAPARQTQVGQWLRHVPGPGAVVHLPIAEDVANTPAMVQSLEHRRPLINGYSGQRPEFYNALADSLSAFPSDEALVALREAGARFVVTPAPVQPGFPGAAWPLVERARLADGVIYELHWTPELEARLAAGLEVVPPAPGAVPFRAGERARYAAFWAGAGVNVAAGEIAIEVGDPAYTFVARADTAPWMARFFEAHDTFTTRTDSALLPLLHERDQREGSRHVTRTFVFRHDERIVRIGRDVSHAEGEEGLSLPLAAAARDAISAVFYVRTLPLEPGARYRIPINEAGRSLLLEVSVRGREQVQVQGKTLAAVRLDPVIRRRVERRRPITAALWLSDDDSRVPVAMDVDAAFGRVRLELTSYAAGSGR